jgi:hypothetical protein
MSRMDLHHELLDAVHRREIRTLYDVGAALGVAEADALHLLRAAASKAFVIKDADLSGWFTDDGQPWRLTESGHAEWGRLNHEAES